MDDAIEQNLSWLLVRAAIPAKRAFMQAGELSGLTHMQLFTLCLVDIDKDGETTMHAITKMLACDASNVTGLIEKLVQAGFIERSESSRDRRIKLIKLTAKGQRTRKHVLNSLASVNMQMFVSLTDKERQTLTRLLVKLLASCDCTPTARASAKANRVKSGQQRFFLRRSKDTV